MTMQNSQQYEQLVMQYNQLINGGEIISKMIDDEDFDNALSLLQSRRSLFNKCKSMLSYLELTSEQKIEIESIKNTLENLERTNIEKLEARMKETEVELNRIQKTQKFQNAYGGDLNQNGNIVDYKE